MKKSMWILFGILLLLPCSAKAEVEKKTSGMDKCVNENTCIQVCEWQNDEYHVYAYYFFSDQSWQYSWYYPWNPFLAKQNDANPPTKHIFYESNQIRNDLSTKGSCAQAAYVDVSGMGISHELCFDSKKTVKTDKNGNKLTYCHNASNAGTKFEGSSNLIGSVDRQIEIYFENYAIENLSKTSCDDLSDTTGYKVDQTKIRTLLDDIRIDFSHNFLHDKKMPEFMKNGIYKTKMEQYEEKLTSKVNTCGTQLIMKAKTALEKGELSQSKFDEIKKHNTNLENTIHKEMEDVTEDINSGRNPENSDGEFPIVEPNCESLLSPTITNYLKAALSAIQIVGVLLAILLGMVDFVGALLSGEADSNKKAFKKFMIRLVVAAVLLIVPALVKLILGTIGVYQDSICIL